MTDTTPLCPVCDAPLRKSDLPKHSIYDCKPCSEIFQLLKDGTIVPLGDFLVRSEFGDDRVKAAISKPHVANLRSFTEVYSNVQHRLTMEMSEANGSARVILARAENRLDYVIKELLGLDMVSDEGGRILEALREARELISTTPKGHRGIPKKEGGSAAS